jgi:hypothetical protein
MDDISGVSRIEFVLGRGQPAIPPKQGKGRKDRKDESPQEKPGEDEFHLHAEQNDDTLESLEQDHVDLEI